MEKTQGKKVSPIAWAQERLSKKVAAHGDQKGFTLVELLMVMLVVSILAGVGFAGMNVLQTRTLITKADTYWRVLDAAGLMYSSAGNDLTNGGNGGLTLEDLGPNYIDPQEAPWQAMIAKDTTDNPASTWADGACGNPASADYFDESNERPTVETVYYCIDDAGAVRVWVADAKRTGAATNNP